MNKRLAISLIFLVFIVIACSSTPPQPIGTPVPPKEAPIVEQPKLLPPVEQPKEIKKEISPEVEDLLSKHATKIKSIKYNYRGPQTVNNFFEFYVKGDKIKYLPKLEIKTLDSENSYNTIYLDTTAKTAESYCVAAYCKFGGKKADLEYSDNYLFTPFDFLKVKSAAKLGEEVIDDRTTWKLSTDLGTLWIDTFYGIPLKAEYGGNTYRFEKITVNSLQDSDVLPPKS